MGLVLCFYFLFWLINFWGVLKKHSGLKKIPDVLGISHSEELGDLGLAHLALREALGAHRGALGAQGLDVVSERQVPWRSVRSVRRVGV